jgi:hypothetical protein
MGLVNIRSKIKEKLESKKGEGQPLVDVFDYHKTGFGGYPSATFEPSEVLSDYETNTQNFRKHIFRIVIHQEIEKVGRSKAIDILCGVLDGLMDDFDRDDTLGGTADMIRAVPLMWGIYEEGAGLVMYAEMKLEADKSVDITN